MKNNNWFNSFKNACSGIRYAGRERNFRFHVMAAFAAILTAFTLKFSRMEWLLLLLLIVLVLVMEIINTAIEKICDWVHPQHSIKIKIIKDTSAAAVLLVALLALIFFIVLFIPKLSFILNHH